MKSLLEQMSVYAAYHRHPVNKAIHFVFVPAIVWSTFGLLLLPGSARLAMVPVSLALVAAVSMLLYYLALDAALGVAMVALFAFLLGTATIVQQASGALALPLFLGVFVASWAMQIVGHKVFERRKPALLDDLFQVVVAPAFVVTEWGFLLGLRKGLRAEVEEGLKAHLPRAASA